MSDGDKFWNAVEKIADTYRGDLDKAQALQKLRKLGCDKEAAAELFEGMKP